MVSSSARITYIMVRLWKWWSVNPPGNAFDLFCSFSTRNRSRVWAPANFILRSSSEKLICRSVRVTAFINMDISLCVDALEGPSYKYLCTSPSRNVRQPLVLCIHSCFSTSKFFHSLLTIFKVSTWLWQVSGKLNPICTDCSPCSSLLIYRKRNNLNLNFVFHDTQSHAQTWGCKKHLSAGSIFPAVDSCQSDLSLQDHGEFPSKQSK